MRYLSFLLLSIFFLISSSSCSDCQTPVHEHETPIANVSDLQDELIRVFVHIDTSNGFGNGFAVSEDLVLTNFHVCLRGVPIGTTAFDYKTRFDLVDIDIHHDLCLLRARDISFDHYLQDIVVYPESRHPIVNACTPNGIFEPVPNLIITLSEGTYQGLYPEREDTILFDLETTHGCSGSAIVDHDGYLLGVVSHRMSNWERGVGSADGRSISEFLWRNGVQINLHNDTAPRLIIDNDAGLDALSQ